MFSLYKKELQSYYYSPFAYVIAALFLLVFSITFVVGISDLSGTQYKFSFPNVFYSRTDYENLCRRKKMRNGSTSHFQSA